jgi:hypothetical protein
MEQEETNLCHVFLFTTNEDEDFKFTIVLTSNNLCELSPLEK